MDALVLEDCVLLKADVKTAETTAGREEYLTQFQLD
jgi:hypothetical protein